MIYIISLKSALSEIPRILAGKGAKISSELATYEILAFAGQNSGEISVQA